MKYQPYEKYKDSGVAWLGKIPQEWNVIRLNEAAKIKTSNVDKKTEEGEEPVRLCNYVDVYYYEKIDSKIEFMSASATALEISKFKLFSGDVVLTKDSESPADIGIPALITENIDDLVCGYHLAILKSNEKKTWGPYLYYAVKSRPSAAQFEVLANGITRFGLSQDDLKNLLFALPSVSEQKAIAAFLDEKTAEIDALIAKKEGLLLKLAEKRTAMITHAVTKGLNPSAPMKDSGIDWLGQIPAHWEIKKLKFLGEAILGLTYSPEDLVQEGEGKLVLRSSNVQGGKIVYDDNVFVSSSVPTELMVKKGDILICSRNGSRDLIGKNAIITDKEEGCTFGAFMTIFRSKYGPFLRYVLDSNLFQSQLGRFLTSTINQLTINTLNNFEIPFPNKDEQELICKHLEKNISEISAVESKTISAISTLKEYRSALITNAVTGKIKVA